MVLTVARPTPHSGTHHMAGRGVGLATVKTIVEYYGGQIHVESEIGRGCTFYFTLDRNKVDAKQWLVVSG